MILMFIQKTKNPNFQVEYLLKWRNSWVNATDIRADQIQDYEDALTLQQRRMAMDAKNASCNNNNDNDIDDGVEVNIKLGLFSKFVRFVYVHLLISNRKQ